MLTRSLSNFRTIRTLLPQISRLRGLTGFGGKTSYRLVNRNPGFVTVYSNHYNDVIIGAMASQITRLTIVYSTVYSGADHRKHQSSASLAFVRGIHRRPVNSPHKWPVTRKSFPFDDVIMNNRNVNVVTGWGVSCHFDNKRCSQGRHFVKITIFKF